MDIHLRDGVAVVTERRGGVEQTFTAGEWARLRRGDRALARAHHRGELGIESLLPTATVDAMHAARTGRRPGWRDGLARLFAVLRPAL